VKDQYVGDVKDYFTYGLLRALSGPELPLVVCWMLTPPDGSRDGGKTAYLRDARYSRFDPALHDELRALVDRAGRNVSRIEQSGLLAAEYAPALEHVRRGPPALVFLDPDMGFEAASIRPGTARSGQYVYWADARELYGLGHSLLVFQHALRVRWSDLLPRLAARAGDEVGCAQVSAYVARPGVAFVLLAQRAHDFIATRAAAFAERWAPEVRAWTAS
jgi:hypothetical protein